MHNKSKYAQQINNKFYFVTSYLSPQRLESYNCL